MCHVQTSVQLTREAYIAFDHVCFRRVWHASEPQAKRRGSKVHRAARGHVRVLGMLHHGNIQRRCSRQVIYMINDNITDALRAFLIGSAVIPNVPVASGQREAGDIVGER